MNATRRASLALTALLLAACSTSSDDGQPLTAEEVDPVASTYADIVLTSYTDARVLAEDLRIAVDAFVGSPSEASLEDARAAWLAAREVYGQTEAYRFYDGPIDDPTDGPEGQLNAWPMDEAYVDYVEGMPEVGIINDPTTYPDITIELLSELNELNGETNISTGYHAIEFLLWGQDLSEDGPGARPYTDYVLDEEEATALNPERRGEYLLAAVDLLVEDLAGLEAEWEGSYGEEFAAAEPREIVRRILLGLGSLSGAELAGERMEVALETRDQEDEHSCFSDNTHRDIITDIMGMQNVYLGSYGDVSGDSVYDLVAARDQELADRLRDEMAASLSAAEAIPAPFDQAIIDDRESVQATIDALRAQTDTIVEIATLFDINLALE
ncbi:iron-regulated protein [Pseudenhygromyxa sp. WMMC2535]|uniref:imelysin family protein n=1 Tax=Pseudenhygromyxa sp. WMMC2535 TaxID=2712867 RepID=UPI001557EBA2|nr:imelysin family protein [Pseudenhygromyxa sp. WMMC2535]NVB38160.1 iron-regulated protein [Pseudenhygromyxa sp. WMMC2535]